MRSLLFASLALILFSAHSALASDCVSSITTRAQVQRPAIESLTDPSAAELPRAVIDAIKAHPIYGWNKRTDGGKGLFFFNPFLASQSLREKLYGGTDDFGNPSTLLELKNYKGEVAQSRFIAKVLDVVFPDADGSAKSPDEFGTRANRIAVWIGEPSETGQAEEKRVLPMRIIKAANPRGIGLPRMKIRERFGFPPGAKVLSLYIRDRQSITAQQWPTFIKNIERGQNFDFIFLSFGSPGRHDEVEEAAFLRSLFGDVKGLSAWTKEDAGRTKLILNDTIGLLPNLHAASDLAIVVGPINLFEPLMTGTPTVLFNNERTNRQNDTIHSFPYSLTDYERMKNIAIRTNGAVAINDFENLETAVREAMTKAGQVNPPIFVEDETGQTALNRFLTELETHLRKRGLGSRLRRFIGW